MMFDVEIITLITMCDLMDQFPNFMFRNQTYIILMNFSPDFLKFSILRFYNDEKHCCSFRYQLNQL